MIRSLSMPSTPHWLPAEDSQGSMLQSNGELVSLVHGDQSDHMALQYYSAVMPPLFRHRDREEE